MNDAWVLAHEAAAAAGVTLAPLRTVEDADAIEDVIAATWGDQPIGTEIVRALAESGNEPYGALERGRLVAFVLGWLGMDADGLHVHSHMLAARPDRRHAGVGYALKLAQRAHALDRGVRVIRWTFDPLVARNAYFNLTKLGAVAERFGLAFYGDMLDDLNRDDRSDRLVVRWDLDEPPGRRDVRAPAEAVLRRQGEGPDARPAAGPRPADDLAAADLDAAAVEIPRDYPTIREKDPALASAWRDAVADALEACLAAGFVASGFDRARSAYVLTRAAP